MCGRYALLSLAEFTDLFPWIRALNNPLPRYNIAPTQPVAAIANTPEPVVDLFHWGLIPSWAKDPAIGNRMINARAETLAQKPAFKASLRRKRCLIPASGFFEWKRNPRGGKTPMYIATATGRPFAFAGLWDTWQAPDGSTIPSCTIVTVPANALVAPIHDRMPAILLEEHYQQWLDPAEHPPEDLLPLLQPYPPQRMAAHAVSTAVNSPKNDGPECIRPAAQESLFPE